MLISLDLGKIQSLSEDMPQTTNTLSDTTRLICLELLSNVERWMWRKDAEKLTDSEWDEAEAIVTLAQYEIMNGVEL
jgi:hypothetical protein